MSVRRLTVTSAVMATVAVLLGVLTPPLPVMAVAFTSAQQTADSAGPEMLVTCAAGLLAWLVWAWGALGLALTAATAAPGLIGAVADGVVRVILPAGARRSAALALGLGLGVAAPLLGVAALPLATPASAAVSSAEVPDWPASVAPAVPDWPVLLPASPERPTSSETPPVADWSMGSHVVVRGDCLWDIAADALLQDLDRLPTHAETATQVQAWWAVNADVIGSDPDRLLPGQVLRAPGRP